MLTFKKTEGATGTLYRAEYHVVAECLMPNTPESTEHMEDFLEKYVKRSVADKMMLDLIEGAGDRGVSMGDVYRHNQHHSLQGSAKNG